MIKKFSCIEILDKNIFMSVTFSCNFRNFVSNFLVKFDPTMDLIGKLSQIKLWLRLNAENIVTVIIKLKLSLRN
jgi:hypothetical protein